MENTARKLSAQELIKEFSDQNSGNLDLLKIFLITNSADIAREYEFQTKLLRNASSETDKAIYKQACQTLINISLRRIALSDIIYSANNSGSAIIASEQETTNEVGAPIIMMLPSLDEILVRVTTLITESKDIEVSKTEAFELLKTSVGQGKVINADGKPETWDNEKINLFITNSIPTETKVEEAVKEGTPFKFENAYKYFTKMIENGKTEPEIKLALTNMLIGKIIVGSTPENDYYIKDEAIFEDYYKRIMENVVITGITAFAQKSNTVEITATTKEAAIAKKIEEEIKPTLSIMDKDETQTSVAPITKQIRNIYTAQGFKMSLKDAWLKARELAEKFAPNLLSRVKEGDKNNIDPLPTEKKKEESSNKVEVEIYDDSHNIQESNKTLWAEVEKYEHLTQLFDKAVELSKKGNWRDALSMSIILISSGKIKETKDSTEPLKWETENIKLWFHNIVEASAKPETEKIIDVKAEVINEKGKNTEKPAESNKPSSETGKETKEVKQGPVPRAGSIDSEESKENLSRVLKDNTPWKDTYKFKSFLVKTDHHRGGAMSLEIVDATKDQEKDLLITESNMTEFFDNMRNKLIETRNNYPEVKETIKEKLSPFYEISNSEIKRIVGNLSNEAEGIRKANKTAKVEILETVKVLEVADKPTEEAVAVPPITPAVKEESVASSEVGKEDQSPNEATENTAGEPSTNSSKEEVSTISYEGFENILKAKNKLDMDKAIFVKISEYPKSEDGIKAVFEVINEARKDHHYKKSCIRNYKGASTVDLLSKINNVFTIGTEATKKQ